MTGDTKGKRGGRPRGDRIEVWVTPVERGEIAARADEAGLSLSSYLRAAGLHHRIKSVYDLDAVRDLAKVNGDLGRVAGLLKWWLVDGQDKLSRREEVERLLIDFRALQNEVTTLMKAVRR